MDKMIMNETTLQKQIRLTNEKFDEQEKELKSMRYKAIQDIWKYNIESGLLKQELSNQGTVAGLLYWVSEEICTNPLCKAWGEHTHTKRTCECRENEECIECCDKCESKPQKPSERIAELRKTIRMPYQENWKILVEIQSIIHYLDEIHENK